jgi:hypothetical protein
MRWSVEVTVEEARAPLGVETPRHWSDHAIARTTPVLLALFSRATMLALRLSQGGQIPVPVTAWSRKSEATFADCLALVAPLAHPLCGEIHSRGRVEAISPGRS